MLSLLDQLYNQYSEAMDNLKNADSLQDKSKYTREALELSEKINELEV